MNQKQSDDAPRKSDFGTDVALLGDEHVRRYRETCGAVGYLWNGATILLMSMIGRKSGQERTIPIIYAQVADAQVIIASKGGSPTHGPSPDMSCRG